MISVLFVMPSLHAGGSERVVINLLKKMNRDKYFLSIILFREEGELIRDMPVDVCVHQLKRNNILGFGWTACFQLSNKISHIKPDIVISFMWYTNFITILARLFCKFKFKLVISERATILKSKEGIIWELFRRYIVLFLYRYSDLIITNSKQLKSQLTSFFRIKKEKVENIYNPLDIDRINNLKNEEINWPFPQSDIPSLIGIGRICPQKGFKYLIRAVGDLNIEGVKCNLVILGEIGSRWKREIDELKKMVERLGLGKRVCFMGYQANPYKYLSRSDIFVLSSLYEGFPNVLLEALAVGTPSVATRCPTGPEEIINNGINGILIEPGSSNAIVNGVKYLLSNSNLRENISKSGLETAKKYDINLIVKEYEDRLSELMLR